MRFLVVDPGEMDTDMHRAALPDADPSTLAACGGRRPGSGGGTPGERGARVVPAPGPGDHDGLVWIDPTSGSFSFGRIGDLPAALRPGDLLVVNDAATLPASLIGEVRGEPVEIRLARSRGRTRATSRCWRRSLRRGSSTPRSPLPGGWAGATTSSATRR